jgi:hypothetical protein
LNWRWHSLLCLLAIGASFGIGLLVFSPRADRLAPAAQMPAPVLLSCAAASDRGCLTTLPGHDIEVVTTPARPITAAAEPAREPVPVEAAPTAVAAPPVAAVAAPPAPATAVEPPAAVAAVTPPAAITPPAATTAAPAITRHRPPAPRRAATAESEIRPPAAKKAARREFAAKRRTREAPEVVRRFGDDLRDLPVSSYAGDGTRRGGVIRPTNIQDYYYYGIPRP